MGIKITATALLALWLCIYPVFGAQITVSEYDRDTQMASVGGMSEYEYVTIQVTKGGDVYFESQQDTQEGAFLFEFMLEGNSEEEIAVKIGEPETEQPTETGFTYYGGQAAKELLAQINEVIENKEGKETAALLGELRALFAEGADILNLPAGIAQSSDTVYESILRAGICENVQMLKENVEDAVFTENANRVTTTEDLLQFIEENWAYIREKLPTVSATYESSEKSKAVEALLGKIPFHNREAFLNEFAFEALRCAINGAGGWESAKKIITENAEFLGVDVTKAQENESQVYLGMINASFRSLSQIKEEFERLCEENAADDSGDSGSSGGGGGSGGSGGGGGSSGWFGNAASTGSEKSYVPLEPVQPDATPEEFSDLDQAPWAREYIYALQQENIINGENGVFRPNDAILREEFIKMLILTLDIQIVNGEESFSDVEKDAWYQPYISTAKACGISKGKEDGTFGVGEKITRQDLVAMAYRAVQAEEEETAAASFSDRDSIGEYAVQAVDVFASWEIVNGKEENQFCPLEPATRAETAKILYLLREKIKSINYVQD